MAESVLIVEDQASVRQTYLEWLAAGDLGCAVRAVGNAADALAFADEHPVDLAVLDWNLGAGSDGLQLLQDLNEFQPDVVAILITAYADQATPLDALRLGVRDYLDKNQSLTRESFRAAVATQLERIRPAKQQRLFHQRLERFRDAVERILPLVESAAVFNDPVPVPEAARDLLRFVVRTTGAADAVLVVRHADGAGERVEARGIDGGVLNVALVPFSRSLAASVLSAQEATAVNDLGGDVGPHTLQPFEAGRRNLLAVPVPLGPTAQVVVELFDKPGDFTEADRRLLSAAGDFGRDLLRQAMAERQTHRVLFDAVAAALEASRQFRGDGPAPADAGDETILERLRRGMEGQPEPVVPAGESVRLAEAIRSLAARHGPAAVAHCTNTVEGLHRLLDEQSGDLDD